MNSARSTTAAAATAVVLATTGGLLAAVAAPASAATACTSPVFKRQFYANTKFSGTPKKTDCDTAIDENWSGAPAKGLPKDNFGVRWSVTRDFGSGGPFTFSVSGFDGMRVYLDGKRKVDVWKNVSKTVSKSVNVTIPSGTHTLRVDYVNWTGAAKVKFAYTPRTAASVDKVKPLVPGGAAVAYDKTTGKAKVTWAKNKEMDLAGYRVYRRDKGASFPAKPLATASASATSYTDGTLPQSGATYYYEVRAYDKAGNESAGTADKGVTTVDRMAPVIRDFKVTNESAREGVSFGWKTGEGPLDFQLLRSASAGGPFTVIKSFRGESATDVTAPYGDTSFYKVAVTDAAGNTGYSPVVSFTRPLAVPEDLVAIDHLTEDGGSVDLSWEVSQYAPKEFRVHREERLFNAETGTYDTVESRIVPCEATLVRSAFGIDRYGCSDTTFAGRPSSGEYVYRVTTVDARGRESAPSDIRRVHYRDTTPPPAVTGLTAEATEYGTVLAWDESTADDIASYQVFRKTSEDDPTGTTWVGEVKAGMTRFVDTENLQDGGTHTYFVNAVDASGNSLIHTNGYLDKIAHATVTEHDVRPTVETPEDHLVSVKAKAGSAAGTVQLDWDLNTVRDRADYVGYRISRWNPATAAYEPLTEEPVTEMSYTDTAAPAGTTYFYRVTALLVDGTESGPGAAWVAVAP
ncbi:PA14 domain-containing protein [Streptomyces sp. NPDC048717]|uniref:PA14 domain-containing protein n=1 Tax=Streptomyces sp. NPDC048717 TaxID=3154928 RepID=UPI0034245B98